MFGKTRREQKEIRTLLGTGTRVVGHLSFEGGLHVDGSVEGNIIAPPGVNGSVSISSSGTVEGNVEAPEVVLNGTVKGDVFASERVELGPTARVVGNVVYNLIEMAIGAEVNGKLIHRPAGDAETEAEAARDPDPASS
jgi:cytoskeletal protein CcmA (bactofilin family)